MKIHILILALLVYSSSHAQSEKHITTGFFNHLQQGAIILSDDGLRKENDQVQSFVDQFTTANEMYSYTKDFSIDVNSTLVYEIGEISTNSDKYSVMFLRRTADASTPGIEFLNIFKQDNTTDQISEIDRSREEWMQLCNAHLADKLVEKLYTSNAYYYNRGRLLQGTESITTEYDYMNNPDYSLKLTPKHLTFVNANTAYEIGQCSGSYSNPYMLIWEKQSDGRWLVLMDSND